MFYNLERGSTILGRRRFLPSQAFLWLEVGLKKVGVESNKIPNLPTAPETSIFPVPLAGDRPSLLPRTLLSSGTTKPLGPQVIDSTRPTSRARYVGKSRADEPLLQERSIKAELIPSPSSSPWAQSTRKYLSPSRVSLANSTNRIVEFDSHGERRRAFFLRSVSTRPDLAARALGFDLLLLVRKRVLGGVFSGDIFFDTLVGFGAGRGRRTTRRRSSRGRSRRTGWWSTRPLMTTTPLSHCTLTPWSASSSSAVTLSCLRYGPRRLLCLDCIITRSWILVVHLFRLQIPVKISTC